jgi:hypothetical protein
MSESTTSEGMKIHADLTILLKVAMSAFLSHLIPVFSQLFTRLNSRENMKQRDLGIGEVTTTPVSHQLQFREFSSEPTQPSLIQYQTRSSNQDSNVRREDLEKLAWINNRL